MLVVFVVPVAAHRQHLRQAFQLAAPARPCLRLIVAAAVDQKGQKKSCYNFVVMSKGSVAQSTVFDVLLDFASAHLP